MNNKSWAALTTLAAGVVGYRRYVRASRRMSFRNRVVVITGGSRGLGLVMARRWAAQGAKLARAVRDVASRGADSLGVACDVRDQEQVNDAVTQVLGRFGRIDVLVNNAGTIQVGPLDHMTLDDYRDAMAVHFWGPLYSMRAVIPHMRSRGTGRIVNISSIGGKIAVPHLAPYSASKFALTGLSDAMRAELVEDNIYVTTVCPGLMRTGSPGNALFKGRHHEEFTWFALLDSLPVTSISAERAAAKVIAACRDGDAQLVISVQPKLAVLFHNLMPELSRDLLAATNRLLPEVSVMNHDQAFTGWESEGALAPSVLTCLSDQAAARNNELPQNGSRKQPSHTPGSGPGSHAGHSRS